MSNIIVAVVGFLVTLAIITFMDMHPVEETVLYSLKQGQNYSSELSKSKLFVFVIMYLLITITLYLISFLLNKKTKLLNQK